MNIELDSVRFVVEGSPRGFVAQWGKVSWNTKHAYGEYAKLVRIVARSAGLHEPVASRDFPVCVHTRAFFRDGRHPDPENVHKAVCDALFYHSKLRDKFTGGAYTSPLYDTDNPRVEVIVADGRRPLKETIPDEW